MFVPLKGKSMSSRWKPTSLHSLSHPTEYTNYWQYEENGPEMGRPNRMGSPLLVPNQDSKKPRRRTKKWGVLDKLSREGYLVRWNDVFFFIFLFLFIARKTHTKKRKQIANLHTYMATLTNITLDYSSVIPYISVLSIISKDWVWSSGWSSPE